MLKPTDPKARLVGRALTVMNVAANGAVPENVAGGVSGLAEIEAHNLAEPGDILVLQGVDQIANMGGFDRPPAGPARRHRLLSGSKIAQCNQVHGTARGRNDFVFPAFRHVCQKT